MEKQRLTTLINQPTQITEKDFNGLLKLRQEFPYFQAISPLITLASKKYAPQTEKKHLQSAAIYAFDRKHLKAVLTKDYVATADKKDLSIENKVIAQDRQSGTLTAQHEKPKPQVQSEAILENTANDTASSHLPESFFEELYNEMESLKAEKENYLRTLEKFEAKKSESENSESKAKTKRTTSTRKSTTSKSATAKKPTTAKKTPVKKASTTKKSTASKKSTLAKAKDSTASKKSTTSKAKESTKKTKPSAAKKADKVAEKKPRKDEFDIIEEITARKELKINDAHKKEQLDIINRFIEKDPVLTKRLDTDNQSSKQEAEDLSANSANLSDDVVSETLAKLMIKQGRKQKAIDIYKKLIWKFPQKKTYFVEIIEELKKES